MRFTVGLLVGLLAASAWAAEPAGTTDQNTRRNQRVRLWELETLAMNRYPQRRDSPLRELNITDEEVREVQAIAREYEMSEYVNISPVVTGCPCEEGGSCTEQVYITSAVAGRSAGLQLSRMKNLWTVGVVQKWWLEYSALRARVGKMTYEEYQRAHDLLLLQFPMCEQSADVKVTSRIAEASPQK